MKSSKTQTSHRGMKSSPARFHVANKNNYRHVKMWLLALVSFILFSFSHRIQEEIFTTLKKRYEIPNGLSTELVIEVQVPGITVPTKSATIVYENGKAPKITGQGLLFFPKKGLFEEFLQLLNGPFHAIPLGTVGSQDSYKLVSMNPKSDWITADIKVNKTDPRIDEIFMTTRNNGDFQIFHTYEQGAYPVKTEVKFESDRFSIPLKFLGKGEPIPKELEGKKVSGKIVLTYKNLKVY